MNGMSEHNILKSDRRQSITATTYESVRSAVIIVFSLLSISNQNLFTETTGILHAQPFTGASKDFTSPVFFPVFPSDPQHGFKEPFITERKWGLESIRECNYTMAGYVRPEDLPLCEKFDLKAILVAEHGSIQPKRWKAMSDAEIDSTVKKMMNEGGKSKAVMGYLITDEPGASCFPALGKAVEAVKKYAPGKVAFLNIYPNYATLGAPDMSQLETNTYLEYLERFVTEVRPQFISYDNYMVLYSLDMRDAGKAALYYTNLMDVRAVALKYGIPFWNTVSANQIRPHTTIPSPANLMFQAYTSLAAGARGIKWFTYYSRNFYGYAPIDKNDNKSLTWYYLHEINREIAVLAPVLNTLRSTGFYFTAPAPVDTFPLLPGRIIKSVAADAPIMVGEFRGEDGADYAMVVNLSLERSTKFTIEGVKQYAAISIISPADGFLVEMDREAGYWLVSGQGVLVKFEE